MKHIQIITVIFTAIAVLSVLTVMSEPSCNSLKSSFVGKPDIEKINSWKISMPEDRWQASLPYC